MIYLSRSNIFEQAVSVVIARQSGVWHKLKEKSSAAMEVGPKYDAGMLRNTLKQLVRERSMWESFFALYEVAPLRIAYEEFAFEPASFVVTCRRVLQFLGYNVPPDYSIPNPTTLKLGTELNVEWAERLRSECRGDSEILELLEW